MINSHNTKDQHNPSIIEENYSKMSINPTSRNFKRFSDAGLLNEIDESLVSNIQEYWVKHYGKNVDPVFHIAFKSFTGINEPRLIPSQEMWNEILPFFNDMNMRIGYSDKNTYDRLINPSSTTDNVLNRVRGNYFDSNNNGLDSIDAYKLL